jgi:5-methylcytosine-specific restriction endonuclease McrA
MQTSEQEKSQAIYEEIVTGMKDWRVAHPKATMREIEIEARERVSKLEAHLIEESALTSAAKEWANEPEEERPCCPSCGEPLAARGKHVRKLQATGGREVKLERSYGVCPKCETGFFPPR